MKQRLTTSKYAALALITLTAGTVLLYTTIGDSESRVRQTASVEVVFSSYSPRGVSGGAVLPASCESGFSDFPGECAPPYSEGSYQGSYYSEGQYQGSYQGSYYSEGQYQGSYQGAYYTQGAYYAQGAYAPPSVDLKINGSDGPLTFEALAGYTAAWSTANASSCNAAGSWSGPRATGGVEGFSDIPRGNYSYALTCAGPGGQTSDSVQVTVIQVPQGTFTPNPGSITLPETSTLTWSLQFADSCVIDHGIGAVNPVSGSREVQPQQTTTYTLTCQGVDGPRSFQATVKVFSPSRQEVLPR